MRFLTCFTALILTAACTYIHAESPVAPGAQLEKLSDGFKFTEGPTADAQGNVYFTDQPNNRIHKWSVDRQLSIFLEPAGRANGLCFDAQGMLWACEDGLVGGIGNVDGFEFASPVKASELECVALVGLNPITRLRGDHRGGDDDAGNAQLLKPTRDDVAAGGRLVDSPQLTLLDFVRLEDASEHPRQGNKIAANGAK